jgi:hypothetical protein
MYNFPGPPFIIDRWIEVNRSKTAGYTVSLYPPTDMIGVILGQERAEPDIPRIS